MLRVRTLPASVAAAAVAAATAVVVIAGGPPAYATACLEDVVAVAGGRAHSLAARNDGTVWAWGLNDQRQLGDGTTTNRSLPVAVSGLTGVTSVSAGVAFSMALRSDGTVWTWGHNAYGQLGDGTTTDRATPVQVPGVSGVVAIAAAGYHALALRSDGTVRAWGYNINGQTGDGTTGNYRLSPVAVQGLTNVTAVAGGTHHSIALRGDGTVWTWGYNVDGQLGDGTTTGRATPVAVTGLTNVAGIAGGQYHSVAVRTDGTARAWGDNAFGQLGNSTTADSTVPVIVSGLTGIAEVGASGLHSVARRGDGTAWAWGLNNTGQLGDGTMTNRLAPVSSSGFGYVSALAPGWNHTLALRTDDTVWSWGHNHFGQLGDGTSTGRTTPGRAACSTPDPPPGPPAWAVKPGTGPSGRHGAAMAFDSVRGVAILFGGQTAAGRVNDTWSWDGTAWTNVTPSTGNPPARSGASLVYDKAHDRVLLFGGISAAGAFLADTWTWNGTGWTNVTPASGNPAGRHSHAAAYFDNGSGETVVFGGSGLSGTLGDTWSWNGASWSLRSSGGPAPRSGAAMAYFTAGLTGGKELLLFGGLGSAGNLGDTWAWTGTGWSLGAAAGPPPAYLGNLVYDRARRQAVAFGGCGATFATCPHGATWAWGGTGWTTQTWVPSPPARYGAAMAYDTVRRQTVLFGGSGCAGVCLLNDTWTF